MIRFPESIGSSFEYLKLNGIKYFYTKDAEMKLLGVVQFVLKSSLNRCGDDRVSGVSSILYFGPVLAVNTEFCISSRICAAVVDTL